MRRKWWMLVGWLAMVVVLVAGGEKEMKKPGAEGWPGQVVAGWEYAKVIKAVDGDTVELEDGRKVRYIGIDTPEVRDSHRKAECFGKEAWIRNQQLVEGKLVGLEKDVSDTDRYGRLLRYVHVDGAMVNKILVAEGLARAVTFPPDVANQTVLREAEGEARTKGAGLWNPGKCGN